MAELVTSLSLVGDDARGLGDAESALRALADRAVEQEYADAGLPDALVAGEAARPSGLATPLPVAIPYADTTHALRPGVGALVPEAPIAFGRMGGSEPVAVRLVVLLLIDDPQLQFGLVGRLSGALQRPDLEATLLTGLMSAAQLAERFDRLLAG